MEASSTTASSRRTSFSDTFRPKPNPKYKQLFQDLCDYHTVKPHGRIRANTEEISQLTAKTKAAFDRSYLFEPGKQLKGEHFKKTFCGVYGAYRGSNNLVDKVGLDLAKSFSSYVDVSEAVSYIDDSGGFNRKLTHHMNRNLRSCLCEN